MTDTKKIQVRCPYCNGRLFDISLFDAPVPKHEPIDRIVIKCWKCRRTINIDYKYLVQTPQIYGSKVGV